MILDNETIEKRVNTSSVTLQKHLIVHGENGKKLTLSPSCTQHKFIPEILLKRRRSLSVSSSLAVINSPNMSRKQVMHEGELSEPVHLNRTREPTLDCLYGRIRYNSAQNTLLLNFEGLHFQTDKHVHNIRHAITNILASHSKESREVRCMVNYDGCIIEEAIRNFFKTNIDNYLTNENYISVQQFSTKNFIDKLKSTRLPQSPSTESIDRIVASQYRIQRLLGEGTYGKVWLAQDQNTGVHVAIKEYDKAYLTGIPELAKFVSREVEILNKVKGGHTNVVNLLNYSETNEYYFLVMEFCQLGCLESPYEPHQQFSEHVAHKYFVQMTNALEFLHEQHRIVHRDLQLSNVCVDINDDIKIVDFGVSDFFDPNSTMNIICGNSAYACPEMLLGKPYVGPEADLWSLGCCLYKMLTGYHPFRSAQKALVRDFMIPLEEEEELSEEVKDLMNHILCLDVKKRFTIKDIKQHPWYRNGPH